MICGTFVLTDSISNAFDAIFTQIYKNTDAVITGKSAVCDELARTTCRRSPSRCSPKVRSSFRRRQGGDRRRRRTRREPDRQERQGDQLRRRAEPRLQRRPEVRPEFSSLTLVERRLAGAERGRDRPSARRARSTSRSATRSASRREGAAQPFRVSGLVKFGALDVDIGGATLAGFDLATAQRLFDKVGKLDQIRVRGSPASRRAELRRPDPADPARRRRRCGRGTEQARRTTRATRTLHRASCRTSCSPSAASRSSSARS